MTRARKPTRTPAAGKAAPPAGPHNRLRIIGGRWRGVRIPFPEHPELRPSPDRVRETLFNWLQPVIVDARCLDLFAGSGALGIEALSRGAREVVFIERDARAANGIEQTLQRLGAGDATVLKTDALQYLQGSPANTFNVVFLDPPYASGILPDVCDQLARRGWLAPDALIYLESPARDPLPPLPAGWAVHRSRQAGQVGYHLLRA